MIPEDVRARALDMLERVGPQSRPANPDRREVLIRKELETLANMEDVKIRRNPGVVEVELVRLDTIIQVAKAAGVGLGEARGIVGGWTRSGRTVRGLADGLAAGSLAVEGGGVVEKEGGA